MRHPLEVRLDSAVGEMQDVVACRVQEFLRIHLVKPFLGFFQVVLKQVVLRHHQTVGMEVVQLKVLKAIHIHVHVLAQPPCQGLVVDHQCEHQGFMKEGHVERQGQAQLVHQLVAQHLDVLLRMLQDLDCQNPTCQRWRTGQHGQFFGGESLQRHAI